MATQISIGIWTMDGPEVVFAGASMRTRMTVIRLHDGRLWVHSPIELSRSTHAFLDDLGGEIAALIAPNKFHYMFIEQWREAFPDARVFVDEDLVRKRPSLAIAEVLTNSTPSLYSREIDQVVFRGNRLFQEVVFFHKASRSLIFTDLMINLKADRMKLIPRLFLEFEGVTYPSGGVPRLYRWFSSNKAKAREALSAIRAWKPTRVLFCHGEPFDLTAEKLLDREFKYLN